MASHRDDKGMTGVPASPADGHGPAAAGYPGPGPHGGATRAAEVERPSEPYQYGSKAPEFIRRSRSLFLTWRIAILVVGSAVIAGGVLLLALPGPGWLVIFAGLAILGTEFAWAQRLLHWVRDKVKEAAQRAVDPKVRRRNAVILAVLLVLLAVGVSLYVWKLGWRVPW